MDYFEKTLELGRVFVWFSVNRSYNYKQLGIELTYSHMINKARTCSLIVSFLLGYVAFGVAHSSRGAITK